MTRRIITVLAAVFIITINVSYVKAGEKEDATISIAEKWLSLTDSGDYAKSYDEAASYFKNALKKEKWEESINAVRPALGKLVSRKVKNATYTTTLPGAPDGEYVVITFEASFENKKSATETVTPMLDNDGKWRVAGYYIK